MRQGNFSSLINVNLEQLHLETTGCRFPDIRQDITAAETMARILCLFFVALYTLKIQCVPFTFYSRRQHTQSSNHFKCLKNTKCNCRFSESDRDTPYQGNIHRDLENEDLFINIFNDFSWSLAKIKYHETLIQINRVSLVNACLHIKMNMCYKGIL